MKKILKLNKTLLSILILVIVAGLSFITYKYFSNKEIYDKDNLEPISYNDLIAEKKDKANQYVY